MLVEGDDVTQQTPSVMERRLPAFATVELPFSIGVIVGLEGALWLCGCCNWRPSDEPEEEALFLLSEVDGIVEAEEWLCSYIF